MSATITPFPPFGREMPFRNAPGSTALARPARASALIGAAPGTTVDCFGMSGSGVALRRAMSGSVICSNEIIMPVSAMNKKTADAYSPNTLCRSKLIRRHDARVFTLTIFRGHQRIRPVVAMNSVRKVITPTIHSPICPANRRVCSRWMRRARLVSRSAASRSPSTWPVYSLT